MKMVESVCSQNSRVSLEVVGMVNRLSSRTLVRCKCEACGFVDSYILSMVESKRARCTKCRGTQS